MTGYQVLVDELEPMGQDESLLLLRHRKSKEITRFRPHLQPTAPI